MLQSCPFTRSIAFLASASSSHCEVQLRDISQVTGSGHGRVSTQEGLPYFQDKFMRGFKKGGRASKKASVSCSYASIQSDPIIPRPPCVKPSSPCPSPYFCALSPLLRILSEASAALSPQGIHRSLLDNASQECFCACLPSSQRCPLVTVALSLRRLDKAHEGVVGLKLPYVERLVLVQAIRHLPQSCVCCTVRIQGQA